MTQEYALAAQIQFDLGPEEAASGFSQIL